MIWTSIVIPLVFKYYALAFGIQSQVRFSIHLPVTNPPAGVLTPLAAFSAVLQTPSKARFQIQMKYTFEIRNYCFITFLSWSFRSFRTRNL